MTSQYNKYTFRPRQAVSARMRSEGYCTWFARVCVCVCVCLSPLILALQGPSRLISDTNGSSATRTRKYVAILFKRRRSRDMALKQATKPPTSTDRYRFWRFRLSGTLAVLRWRGVSARTITRFQRARGLAVRWGAARMLAS